MTRRAAAAYYGGQAALSALVLAIVVPFGAWPLRVPFDYRGDGVIFAALVRGIAEDGPWHLSRIGAPFGADIVDWPQGMWLPFGAMGILTHVLGHPGLALNAFWLLSIVATGLTGAWALQRLRLPADVGFVCGLIYAFFPYAFYRNTSHIPTVFPLIPPIALLCLRIAGAAPERLDSRERWLTLGACLAQGLSYVYYAFFACALLTAAGLVAWLRTREWRVPRLAATGVLLLVLGSAIPVLPSVAYWRAHGRNERLAYKTVADAEHNGLKLRHLVTPIPEHPFPAFRTFAALVAAARFPDETENVTARLGLFGSLGLLALLAFALARSAGLLRADEQLGPAAMLTLTALLVAQVGGIGSLFNVLVSPEIRGYNRIVVFIAFFSFTAAAVLLARALARLRAGRRAAWARVALLVLVCGFGIVDQVPRQFLADVRAATAPQFAEDESFVRLVESRLPRAAMVFQLPHAAIPLDVTSLPPMALYDPGRAFVSSRSVRWSWGSILGRTGDWQAKASALAPEAMVRKLVLAGFSGIWVDRWGYETNERPPWTRLEAELVAATRSRLLVSSQGRYSFVSLEEPARILRAQLGEPAFARAQAAVLAERDQLLPSWREGCAWETGGRSPLFVCGNTARAVFVNHQGRERRVLLSGEFRSGQIGRLTISAGDERSPIELSTSAATFEREAVIPGGQRLRVDFAFDGPCGSDGHSCFEIVGFSARPLAPAVQP